MKILHSVSVLFLTHFLQAQSANDLNWLVGTWERINVRQGQTAFEVWESDANDLKGKGVTLRGEDTVFVEKLSIVTKDGDLFYVAEVSHNKEPTYFRVTSLSESGFVCENPNHDFPKKITYTLKEDQLTAVISGNGKEMGFAFRKKSDE